MPVRKGSGGKVEAVFLLISILLPSSLTAVALLQLAAVNTL